MMLSLSLVCLLVAGCMSSVIPVSKESKLAQASNDLGFDLLRSFKNEKNVFISPFSVSTALALVYLGADGTTAKAMRNVLKYDQYELSQEDIHQTFKTLLTKVRQNSEDYQLSTYNSALVQKDFIILHMYGHALRQYYSADIESVNFETEGEKIKAKINDAVETATKGKIRDFLEQPPSADTKLFLLNAVYFLGNWKSPFNPKFTYDRTFFNNGVEEKKVPMMHKDDSFRCSRNNDLNASVVVLPYKGDNSASMIIVVPNDKTGVAELEQKITQESLNRVLETTRYSQLELSLPKFSIKYSADLAKPLASLGLEELFGYGANLSRLAGDQAQLSVSSVVHKAVIDVNEKGSEAAAATGVDFILLSKVPSLTVNHPFLFFIREESSGMILFSGRVDEL